MNQTRRDARWRRRRIIYNNDGNDVIQARTPQDAAQGLAGHESGELIDDFLDARARTLLGTQVDSGWYCSCMAGVRFSHNTKLGGFHGEGIPLELVETYGRDSLQIQTDFCHENELEAFWSLRMNDVHDSHPAGSTYWTYGLAPFKRVHPEFLMGKPADWETETDNKICWSGLDFSFPEVRDHVFANIDEVARNYDVEGIEMDFFRHYPFFRPTRDMLPVEAEHLEMMTALVRRVRKLADEVGQQRGRPLLVAARTPFNLVDARFIGLDLETWLAEDLLDLLIPGGGVESHMTESFGEVIKLGHDHGVPVYPCIGWGFWHPWTFLDLTDGEYRDYKSWTASLKETGSSFTIEMNGWEGMLPAWRGAATNLFAAGADGIYVFNGAFVNDEVWMEIGDLETMANKDKLFGIDDFRGTYSFERLRELELRPGETAKAHFQVGEDLSSRTGTCRLRLHFWELTASDEISVKLNDVALNGLRPQKTLDAAPAAHWLECEVQPERVLYGENRLEVSLNPRADSAGKPIALDCALLYVRAA